MKFIDQKQLDELSVIDPPGVKINDERSELRKVILLFVEHSKKWGDDLLSAYTNHDREKLAHVAHNFRASASYVGAHEVVALCLNLETSALTATFDQIRRLIELIQTASREANHELIAWIQASQ